MTKNPLVDNAGPEMLQFISIQHWHRYSNIGPHHLATKIVNGM
jgi:hypothetical protein